MTEIEGIQRINFYAGARIDRADHRRADALWIERQFIRAETKVIALWRSHHLVSDALSPMWLSAGQAELLVREGHQMVFLGLEDGAGRFCIDLSSAEDPLAHPVLQGGGEFRDLREFGPLLPPEEGALLAYARGLVHWNRRHRYCGACGWPAERAGAGHLRRCTNPHCGLQHFPRTDPAVIMLVHDGGDRCVLGRHHAWPPGMHSVLAGFVEPGESLEEAVAREVREEVGIDLPLAEIVYHSSQPWPFPSSIMLGFFARADYGDLEVNPRELEDARWYTRSELKNSPENEVLRLSRRDSISRRLIDDWIAGG